MSFLSKIFGGGAKGVTEAARDLSDIAERWHPSDAAQVEMDMKVEQQTQDSVAKARTYDPRSAGGGIVGEFINVIIDAVSRAIRPGVTILLLGACFGWWTLPPPDSIDKVYFMWTQAVITFWFGARTLVKDIPTMINALRRGAK